MAKRDASRSLGGASGKAASALRSRGSRLDAMMDAADPPASKSRPKVAAKKSTGYKKK